MNDLPLLLSASAVLKRVSPEQELEPWTLGLKV